MKKSIFENFVIDYIELYAPMAKALAYWHTQALGFNIVASADHESGMMGVSSFFLTSGDIRLVLTSTYPTSLSAPDSEIYSYIYKNNYGVKRIAFLTNDVTNVFKRSIENGAIPVKFPVILKDANGSIEEAAIKLYDNSEILFINRENYKGVFKPGFVEKKHEAQALFSLTSIDHIASEVRINEMEYWTTYLSNVLGTELVQGIRKGPENNTGMVMNINQSSDKKIIMVIAEPETYTKESKVQQNIDRFGPGIHHLAFATNDIVKTTKSLLERGVDFVKFPSSYYDLLRSKSEFHGIDIDELKKYGILIDKEDDTFLLQKFIKPISDRPFFLYEIVQRVNGYSGFALKNINVLKKAEEIEIMKAQ